MSNHPPKKVRKLEAARERLEDENKNDHLEKIFLLILQSFTSSYMNVVYCGILSALDWTFMD